MDLEKAIPYLEKAKSITPNPLILLNLGDAYTLSGDLNKALDYQKDALQILETEGIEKDKAIQCGWLYNYLPLQKNDTATIQKYVRVPDLDGKKAFAYFDLSYSYALLGDFALADREFTAARQLDPERSYSNFFAYKIHSIENLLTADEDVWQWFTTHREILEGK